MIRTLLPLVLLALAAPLAAQEVRDPEALAVANRLQQAMGGVENWNNTRYIRFDFAGGPKGDLPPGRAHLWDKWEGRYRLEQTTDDGKTQVTLFNAYDKTGAVYVDGQQLPAAEAEPLLEKAHGAFINDTYWLAMPWKWLDPGVNLNSMGEQEYNGKKYDVVELSFKNVGRTPGDRYRGFVAKDTGLMEHWEYTLQSGNEGSWDWVYMETNGIKLPSTHYNGEGRELSMGTVAASDAVNEAHFTDSAAMLR